MLGKFRAAVIAAAVLWLIVLVQIIITRVYVSNTDFTQAFARNQVTVLQEQTEQQNKDSRNAKEGNTCTQGTVRGKLSKEEMKELAQDMFHAMGGSEVLAADSLVSENYYTAYGYTTGIKKYKTINGKRINMNVAVSYDEKKDVTNVIFGSPIVNSDY